MCRHYRSGLHYRESGFDVPSWLQQVSPHSICVGEFFFWGWRIEPNPGGSTHPHDSIPSKDSCQPILPLFFFFVILCSWCFPSPFPGPSPVVLAGDAEGGSRVALGWFYHNWCLPAQGSEHGGCWVWPKELPSFPMLVSLAELSYLYP